MNEVRTTHTPGPWETKVVGDEIWIGVDHPEYGFVTHASVRYGCDEAEELGSKRANARLIAAAPNMLAALKEARAAIAYGERGAPARSEEEANFRATLAKIDRAIASAESSS